jgi:phosphatidylglycerol:prolipoprotein diacylglycerol transferase
MLPYFELKTVAIGTLQVPVLGVLMAIAILVGRWRILRRATNDGIDECPLATLVLVMLVCGLVGARIANAAIENGAAFLAGPYSAVRASQGMYSVGGFYGGLVGGAAWCASRGVSTVAFLDMMDRVTYVLPVSWMIGRLGCSLVHDHIGQPSRSWMAVGFPDGPKYDLGLIEVGFLILLSTLFWVLGKRQRRVGFFFGLFAIAYGGFRAWLDTLALQPFSGDFAGGLLGVAIGLACWAAVWERREQSRITTTYDV